MSRKVALITGSATGLGVQTALTLAKNGTDIVINYRRSKAEANALRNRVQALGADAICVQGDVEKEEDCVRMVQESRAYFGHVHILINNAGPYIFELKPLAEYEPSEWLSVINGNVNAMFYLCKALIPDMRRSKWGRIITFGFNKASEATGWKYRSAYATAKVGLVSLTKTLAMEEAEHGITVNMISPGDIPGKSKEGSVNEVQHDKDGLIAPIGRPGCGEDIGQAIQFLCSSHADFITGSVIDINGGLNYTGVNIPKHVSFDDFT